MKPYRFLAEAEAEVREQSRYFDEQVPGLGDRFIADVESTIQRLRQYPRSGSPISRLIRKAVLRIFKYNVYYLDEVEEIVIVAVAPHRRRAYWRTRLRQSKYRR